MSKQNDDLQALFAVPKSIGFDRIGTEAYYRVEAIKADKCCNKRKIEITA